MLHEQTKEKEGETIMKNIQEWGMEKLKSFITNNLSIGKDSNIISHPKGLIDDILDLDVYLLLEVLENENNEFISGDEAFSTANEAFWPVIRQNTLRKGIIDNTFNRYVAFRSFSRQKGTRVSR